MNTKELLAHLYELETQLVKTSGMIDETRDTFNNRWLRSRLTEIERNINQLKSKVSELEEVYTF